MFASVRNILVCGFVRNSVGLMRNIHSSGTINEFLAKRVSAPQTGLLPAVSSRIPVCPPLQILPPSKIELPLNRKDEKTLVFPSYSGNFINRIDKLDPIPLFEIKEPISEQNIEKQAARLIVIRRRKMKKHKLRKLRVRMKFLWAKIRQKRELKKEKAFQAVLISQIKEAEAFDAAEYVREKLKNVNMLTESKDDTSNKHRPFPHVVPK